MNITAPADLAPEILRQRERLTETVGALTDTLAERLEDFDVVARAEEVLGRAESGASDLLDASTDDDGRPKPVVLIGGAVAAVVVLAALRRRSSKKKAAQAAEAARARRGVAA